MRSLNFFLEASVFLLSFGSVSQTLSQGNLVIVGGGLEANNKSVYLQLISLAGGAENATFAVIPSASGAPMQSYVYFRDILISYGLKPENINLIPVAMVDDDSTTNMNESEWKNNGNNSRLAELVRKCSAVWFTGGDQMRTMKMLIRSDGSNTPVLEAVWEVYHSGGVIGGSSAGAAIMSEVMIGGGTSIAALSHGIITNYSGDDFPEGQGVLVTKGLGLFPHGLVDQHFNARARIGRLVMTLMGNKKEGSQEFGDKKGGSLGFGIDENTALIYNSKQDRMIVAGAAGVTILNTANARIFYAQNLPVIENISLSYLEEGDSYDFTTGIVMPAEGKQSTKGKEHHKDHYYSQDGILSGYQTSFRDLYSIHLADNKATDTIQNISLINNTTGFLITLRKTSLFEGYCTIAPNEENHYTVTNIMLDITPVHISVTPMNNKY